MKGIIRMKKMKIQALLVMGLLSVATTMDAADDVTYRLPRMHTMQPQTGDSIHRQATPEEVTERMTDMLGLTDKQAKKVLELNTKYKNIIGHRMGMRRPGGPISNPRGMLNDSTMQRRPQPTEQQKAEWKDRMEKRRAEIQTYQKELNEILTKEQQQKLAQARQEMKTARVNIMPMN